MRYDLGVEHRHTLEEVGLLVIISLDNIRMIGEIDLRFLRKNVASNVE